MRTNKLMRLAALSALISGGCTPDALKTATVESVERVSAWTEGRQYVYRIGEEERAILRDEFEAWREAGFGDFEYSLLSYAPVLGIAGKLEDGTSYSVELDSEVVVVNETDGNGKNWQNERMVTEADRRFFMFLASCIMDRKFRRMVR